MTSVVMKVLQRLRSTDDAVNMALHYVLEHLDTAGNYARILFADFSWAFNTIIPHTLKRQLSLLEVPVSTCKWITEFLVSVGLSG